MRVDSVEKIAFVNAVQLWMTYYIIVCNTSIKDWLIYWLIQIECYLLKATMYIDIRTFQTPFEGNNMKGSPPVWRMLSLIFASVFLNF